MKLEMLGRVTAVVFALLLTGCGKDTPRPNVLLVTLDTTRVDRLSCYGYERKTSPHLDRLASESTVHTRAYSTSSWTLPAHASLFTGKLPTSHGAAYDPEGPLHLTAGIEGPESWDKLRARGLAIGERTLAACLRDAGYATAAVVAGPWMKRVFGLSEGFEHFDDKDITELNGRPAKGVTDAALAWLDAREGEAPFFLFLNYFDAHGPLMPPPEDVRVLTDAGVDPRTLPEKDRNALLYDAEIHAADRELGQVFDWLRARGELENTWIIVTADHGELFGENGRFGHGVSVSEPEVHIPLVVREPGPARARRDSDVLVQLTDIMPTVLDGLALELPRGMQGRAFGKGERPIVAEAYPLHSISPNGDWRAWFEGDEKYAWNSADLDGLFDIAQDPYEHENLIGTRAERAAEMQTRLEAYLASLPAPGEAGPEQHVDPSTARGLSGMGYTGADEDEEEEEEEEED
ncbi:MAG: sulfatase [bacterium]|nr:sulfatase [bacterium]